MQFSRCPVPPCSHPSLAFASPPLHRSGSSPPGCNQRHRPCGSSWRRVRGAALHVACCSCCTPAVCRAHSASPAPPPHDCLAAEATAWSERCEGLRGSLAAQQAHAAALEAQLGSRPQPQEVEELRAQVGGCGGMRGALLHGSEMPLLMLPSDRAAVSCTYLSLGVLQVRMLRAVSGYAAADDEAEQQQQPPPQQGDSATSGGGGGRLEAALVAKGRRLEHQLTMLRLELAEAKGGWSGMEGMGVQQGGMGRWVGEWVSLDSSRAPERRCVCV